MASPRDRKSRSSSQSKKPINTNSEPMDRRWQTQANKEHRKQRLAFVLGAMILLAIIALPAYGYYTNFVVPPRVLAGQVGDIHFTMGDLVKRIRMVEAAGRFTGETASLATVPFETLINLTESELVRQGAPRLGITVDPSEIDSVIRNSFYPSVPEGQISDPDQLDREFRERKGRYLNLTGLSDAEYRRITSYSLYKNKLREHLGKRVPSVERQVEVWWIGLEMGADVVAVQDRLKSGENFETIAREFNTERQFSQPNGYVGWVPQGAFPELDSELFSIEHNKISEPLAADSGTRIIKITNGPEVRDVSEKMREQFKTVSYKKWTAEEWDRRHKLGEVKVNFNSEWYSWVAKQIHQSRPRVTPQASGSG